MLGPRGAGVQGDRPRANALRPGSTTPQPIGLPFGYGCRVSRGPSSSASKACPKSPPYPPPLHVIAEAAAAAPSAVPSDSTEIGNPLEDHSVVLILSALGLRVSPEPLCPPASVCAFSSAIARVHASARSPGLFATISALTRSACVCVFELGGVAAFFAHPLVCPMFSLC